MRSAAGTASVLGGMLVALIGCGRHTNKSDSTRTLVDTGAVLTHSQAAGAPPPAGPAVAPALSDANILALMTMSNRDEIASGTAAAPKTVHADVRAFAQALVSDHQQLQAVLDSVATARGISPAPPAGADTVAARMQAIRDSVGRLSGAAFDRAFVESQTAAHDKAVDDLNHFAAMVSDTLIRNLIVTTDHRVHDHLTRAERLLPVVGGKAPTARAAGGRPVRY